MDALEEPTVGNTLLEKLLLAIIDGYPDPKNPDRHMRMRKAMIALKGDHYRKGSKEKDDRAVLCWMAVQEQRKQANPSMMKLGPAVLGEDEPTVEYENMTELAREAMKRFGLGSQMTNDKVVIRRLVDKFEADKKNLVETVKLASCQPHYIEHQMLEAMARDLRRCGIKIVLPHRAKAFY